MCKAVSLYATVEVSIIFRIVISDCKFRAPESLKFFKLRASSASRNLDAFTATQGEKNPTVDGSPRTYTYFAQIPASENEP